MTLSPTTRRNLKVLLGALGVATLFSLAEGFQIYFGWRSRSQMPLSRAFAATAPSWYTSALLAPAMFWFAARIPAVNLRRAGFWVAHLGLGAAFAVLHLVIASYVSDVVLGAGPTNLTYLENLRRLLTMYFVLGLVEYAAIVGGYYAYRYSVQLRRRELEASELALRASRLEASLTRANLESLRMQLNPHFLFNALNTISILALKGEKQRVTTMLRRLGELLRLSLENTKQTVPLSEELQFLRHYLEIEQVRFRDRLSVDVAIEREAEDALVPSMILQPLVENAIRHGISRRTGPGSVCIRAGVWRGMLEIEVRDTGPGFPASGDLPPAEGIGLGNTRARLDQLYGTAAELRVANAEEGGAVVVVVLPYRPNPQLGRRPLERYGVTSAIG